MSKPTILMLGPYATADMQALDENYDVLKLWEQDDAQSYLAIHAAKIKGIATRGDLGASKDLIEQLPNLEVIACFGVGTDGIDLTTARTRNIKVSYTPEILNEAVADLAFALVLGIARHIPQADAYTRQGAWAKATYPLLTQVHGKRIGLIGMGRIGQAIAKRAQGFSMQIAYHARNQNSDVPYQHYANLPDLARNCDFLVAILPGGAATQNIVNAEVLEALGPKGFFINVARGSVVDETALLQALQNKTIAGAALDVFWNEPNINEAFFALDNVVLHPHGGSGTVETRAAMGKLVRDNLAAHFSGHALLTPVP